MRTSTNFFSPNLYKLRQKTAVLKQSWFTH